MGPQEPVRDDRTIFFKSSLTNLHFVDFAVFPQDRKAYEV
jgi:hypothetical protein